MFRSIFPKLRNRASQSTINLSSGSRSTCNSKENLPEEVVILSEVPKLKRASSFSSPIDVKAIEDAINNDYDPDVSFDPFSAVELKRSKSLPFKLQTKPSFRMLNTKRSVQFVLPEDNGTPNEEKQSNSGSGQLSQSSGSSGSGSSDSGSSIYDATVNSRTVRAQNQPRPSELHDLFGEFIPDDGMIRGSAASSEKSLFEQEPLIVQTDSTEELLHDDSFRTSKSRVTWNEYSELEQDLLDKLEGQLDCKGSGWIPMLQKALFVLKSNASEIENLQEDLKEINSGYTGKFQSMSSQIVELAAEQQESELKMRESELVKIKLEKRVKQLEHRNSVLEQNDLSSPRVVELQQALEVSNSKITEHETKIEEIGTKNHELSELISSLNEKNNVLNNSVDENQRKCDEYEQLVYGKDIELNESQAKLRESEQFLQQLAKTHQQQMTEVQAKLEATAHELKKTKTHLGEKSVKTKNHIGEKSVVPAKRDEALLDFDGLQEELQKLAVDIDRMCQDQEMLREYNANATKMIISLQDRVNKGGNKHQHHDKMGCSNDLLYETLNHILQQTLEALSPVFYDESIEFYGDLYGLFTKKKNFASEDSILLKRLAKFVVRAVTDLVKRFEHKQQQLEQGVRRDEEKAAEMLMALTKVMEEKISMGNYFSASN